MGECYSKQEVQQLRSTLRPAKPHKCILLESSPTLIIELTNGSIEKISIKTSRNGLQLAMRVEPGVYFTSDNKICIIAEGSNLNGMGIMETAHSYCKASQQPQPSLINPSQAYLVRSHNRYSFIVCSEQLGGREHRFVDLVDLGLRMKQKQICWQDMQFSEIIAQVCRHYSKVGVANRIISNVIVGTDGSVHLLMRPFEVQHGNQTNAYDQLASLLLKALYGKINQPFYGHCLQLEESAQFKHPISLSCIQNLKQKLQEERKNEACAIKNPSLKFIRDYIHAYFYKISLYHPQFIDSLIVLGQFAQAKEIMEQRLMSSNGYSVITEQSYEDLLRMLKIEQNIENSSHHDRLEAQEAKMRVNNAARFLATQFKAQGKYCKSQQYYYQCLLHPSQNRSEEETYVNLAQVCKAANKNTEAESVLAQGLSYYPGSAALYMYMIAHLCDSMRVDRAEHLLHEATTYFHTLEMEICIAKILLTKAILTPSRQSEHIYKAQDELAKVVLDKLQRETTQSPLLPLTVALYHETWGDSYFQQHRFADAFECYHTSKILLKSEKVYSYRLAALTAAEANCQMLSKDYHRAIATYTQAEALVSNSEQCKHLTDAIIGNRAIAKFRSGDTQAGISELRGVLNSIDPNELKGDYNYTFLKNAFNRMIISSEGS